MGVGFSLVNVGAVVAVGLLIDTVAVSGVTGLDSSVGNSPSVDGVCIAPAIAHPGAKRRTINNGNRRSKSLPNHECEFN